MEIRNVGVVGCGLMGAGIVEICARAGYFTVVSEVNQQLLDKGMSFISSSMDRAVDETNRRRSLQMAYNKAHGITPETIQKEITSILSSVYEADYVTVPEVSEPAAEYKSLDELETIIRELEDEMKKAVKELAFERAAKLRDQIKDLQALDMELR